MLGNLKFNTVGREEAAREVIAPQMDNSTKVRNGVLALVALAVLAGIAYASFNTEGGKEIFAPPKQDRSFNAPQPSGVN